MLRQNFHTHTRFSDGHDTPREMIEAALALGFHSLGFSEHSPSPLASIYAVSAGVVQHCLTELRSLAAAYRGEIAIWAGIELDSETPMEYGDWDFIIASVHEMVRHAQWGSIDGGEAGQRDLVERLFHGSWTDFGKAYYERLTEHVMRNKADIVGHFDLPTKYGIFPEDDPICRDAAVEAIREIVKHCPLFELNTGAIARGLRDVPYPSAFLLSEIKAAGGSVIVNSDCHYKEKLTCWFDEAEDFLRGLGFVRHDNERLNEKITGVTIWRAE